MNSQGLIGCIINVFNKKKILPQKSINHDDISDDITTYIRCIFHDFRGPLNNISLGSEILLNSINKDSDEFSTAKTIKESCEFLSESLDGFLNVNRLDNVKINELRLNYQPFNIIGLIKKIQYILLFNIMDKKLSIKYNITPLREWVLGDYKHIQHVLMNLLSNAVKFSDIKSCIEIKLEGNPIVNNNKQHIVISIIDSNPFIPLNIKSHLFEKYNTSNNHDGTGLGLYICKKIIETHGGTIRHYNNSKKYSHGNIFQVDLFLDICNGSSNHIEPTKHNLEEKNASTKSSKSKNVCNQDCNEKTPDIIVQKMNSRMLLQSKLDSAVFTNSQNGKQDSKINIMVIDDSILSRKLMIKMIQINNPEYRIYEAVDGLDALIKMVSFNEIGRKISMLFIDNVMPNLNGELLSKILRGMGYEGIIVGITGNGLQEDKDQYLNNGADYIFIKPFTNKNLTSIIALVKREGHESKCDKKIVEISKGIFEWA